MNAYPASSPSNTPHHFSNSLHSDNAIAFAAAVQALNTARQQQENRSAKPPVMPLKEEPAAPVETTNFSLQVGVEASASSPLHIRALVTSVDKDFTVMTFPAQHDSFLWELNLPAGNYRLEVKGKNADGGHTTADINGKIVSDFTHGSSNEQAYVMHMTFTIA